MKAVVKTISPKMAQEMLKRNTKNRPILKSRVDGYVKDILAGRWAENGESIVFAESGWLADGQHRLLAISKAGIPIECVVVTVSDENAMYYDIGRKRSFKDSVLMNHEEFAGVSKILITAYRTCYANYIARKNYVSEAEADEFVYLHRDEVIALDSLIAIKGKCSNANVLSAIICAYHCGYDADKLNRFYNTLYSGIPESKEENTVLHLRNYLNNNTKLNGSGGGLEKFLRTSRALYCFEHGLKSNPIKVDRNYYEWN